MRTYCNSNAGSQIEPVLWNARDSVWIVSPWISKDYATRLASLSQKGIDVKLITSYDDLNAESIEVLKASANPNLRLLVLDKEKASFIHAKIYSIDNKYGFSGSANLTYSGLHSSVENLSIAETDEEVQKIRNDFMNLWMTFDRKSMSNEQMSSGSYSSIRNALPLSINFGEIDNPNIRRKELVYRPYYFFEYSFRASAGKSPPVLFENNGLVVLDAATRGIVNDDLLVAEVKNNAIGDYVLKTENKYRLTINEPAISDFREARELVLDHIIKANTKHYKQHYRDRSYDRIFVPYRNIIRIIKSGFVKVPVWYVDRYESDRTQHQDVIFGSSGRKWSELIYCPKCQKKFWITQAATCRSCGKRICPTCVNEVGLIFRKKICDSCFSKNYIA